jgi:hypothetical protein
VVHPGSKSRLTPFHAEHFAQNTLFASVARALAEAECLPQKELFESWEVAKRTQRRLHRSKLAPARIVDLACGHGLTGALLALFEPKIAAVLAVDQRIPPCAQKSLAAMERRFPQLVGRVTLREDDIAAPALSAADVVVCVHGCGVLTDAVLDRAIAARAPVAVLPCCHRKTDADTGGLDGWCDFSLAIDLRRAERLRAAGFSVHTQTIPAEITPKNRLLLGVPVA